MLCRIELRVLRLGGYAAASGGYGASLQDLDIDTLPSLPLLQELHLAEAHVRAARGIANRHAYGSFHIPKGFGRAAGVSCPAGSDHLL